MSRFFIILTGIFLVFSLETPAVFAQPQTDCELTNQDDDCGDVNASLLDEIGSVAEIVDALRVDLAEEQKTLLYELIRGESTDKPSVQQHKEYLEQLRSNLRNVVLEQSLVSGDVDFALRRATIRHLTERIAAYEAAYGLNDGSFTTRYNVLPDADLVRLEGQLKTRLRGILTVQAGISETDLSIRARGQIIEIRRELEALRFERTARTSGAPHLLSVAETPTAPDPKAALSAIQRVESTQSAERALFVEIERRTAWNPDDAALRVVQQKMRTGPHRKYFVGLIRNGTIWRSGWPPSRGPPPGAPAPFKVNDPYPMKPGGGGATSAIEEVRDNIAREISAISTGDPLGRAEAAARWNVASHWLNDLVGAKDSGWRAALAVLSEADLRNHLASLQDWKYALARGDGGASLPDWQRALEDRFVDERLAILRSEISIRGPPPPGPEEGPRGPRALQRAAERSYEASIQAPYEEYAKNTLENRRLVELQKLETMASEVDKATVKEALDIQLRRALNANSQAISGTHAAAVEAERVAFVHGRGRNGVLTAVRFGNAKRALSEAGDSLRQQANSMTTNGVLETHVANSIKAGLPPKPTVRVGVKGPISLSGQSDLVKNGARSLPQPHITFASTRVPLAEVKDQLRFDRKFTLTGPNSAKAFRKNPILAPGGVIIDLTLPEPFSERLMGIRYNNARQQLEVHIDGKWIHVDISISPQTARAALGFVFDKRVAAIDIGSFDKGIKNWMVLKDIIPDTRTLSVQEKESLKKLENVLRIVRSNPGVANTEIANSLMAADELIFTALRLEPILLAKHAVFRGIDTLELHQLLRQDEADVQEQSSGYKSVLTVDNSTVTLDETGLHVHPRFDYAVYVGETMLERVSRWFNARDDALRHTSPELRRLEEFSIAVAVIRSAVRNGVDDGLDSLAYVYEPGRPSPSLICRSEIPTECEAPFIKQLTNHDFNQNVGVLE